MNSAVRNALDQASPAVDGKIIPVMREAVATVQMILFQRLKESISRRYPDRREEDRVLLAGALVNNLYGGEATDSRVTRFARRHRELIEEELRGLGRQVPELIPHITDSLRMQTLCDNQEGIHSIPCLLLARELGVLDEERELPLPSTFMLSVRRLGAKSGLVKAMRMTQPDTTQHAEDKD